MATQQNASFFSIPVFHSSSEFRVNTAQFSREDLALFIENLETIENLKRETFQRRQDNIRETRLMLENQLPISTRQRNMGTMPSPTLSVISQFEELCTLKETKKRPCRSPESPTPINELKAKRPVSMRKSFDEDYFSDASTRSNPQTIKNLRREKLQRNQDNIRATRLMLEYSLHKSTRQWNMGTMPSPTSSVITQFEELCTLKETTKRPCRSPESPTPVKELKAKRPVSMRKSSDEDYFSDASPRSNPQTPIFVAKKPRLLFPTATKSVACNKCSSDSEESGIYPLSSTPPQKQLHTRTSAASEKPKRSAITRVVALLMKRQLLRDQQKEIPEAVVRMKKSASNLNVSKEKCADNDLHDIIKEKYKRFALRYIRRLKKHVVVEEEPEQPYDMEVLDEALRSMTL